MDKKNIETILCEEVGIILDTEPDEIEPKTPLADLGLDSLKFVELLVIIEKRFGINLMESGLTKEDFESIDSLAKRINEINEK